MDDTSEGETITEAATLPDRVVSGSELDGRVARPIHPIHPVRISVALGWVIDMPAMPAMP